METRKLFVYGTLKKGFRLSSMLDSAKFIGVDTLKGFDIFSNGSFPMIVKGNDTVKGEVYEVPIHLFINLDFVESAYDRTTVETENGLIVDAYVYRYDTKDLIKLKGEFKR